ncbi:GNAT family N-acetyltransferase [Lutibacter sp.]|uniref:GNAT family N-acetyltransferase n=1 Tax=Lutibacter sp. TaxID=1925666 RepID=UPI0027328FEA|nr:GNAT family N-acetyltransferase [Lutibacter sp.]MDP3312612.1 GNAT family N-acetyltransferase [Lutibacter sp.]
MHNISLRTATLLDIPILYEFEQGIITAERPFDPTLKSGRINYYDIKDMIQSNDTEVVVALFENEIIGSGYLQIRQPKSYFNFDNYGYIGFIFVKPNFRGNAVSQKIIDTLLIWGQTKNVREFRLQVYNDNLSAIKSYEKCGFKKHMIEMRMELKINEDSKKL